LGEDVERSTAVHEKHFLFLTCLELLAKLPQDRPTIKAVLEDTWLTRGTANLLKQRQGATPQTAFQQYALAKPQSLKPYDEVAKMAQENDQ